MIATLLALALAQNHAQLFLEARTAEAERRYEDAVEACTGAIEEDPSGPRAPTCRERVSYLEARRDADGDFGGWTELEEVRATWREADPAQARARVQALVEREDLAELVSVEARLWLARDALDRRGDAVAAEAITARLVEEHHGELRKRVVGVHARALAALGRGSEALAVEEEIRVAPAGPRRTPVEQMLAERRQLWAARVAGGWLALFAAVAAPLAWRGRSAGRPWGLVPIALAAVGAWLIAESWSAEAGVAVPWMAAGFAGVHLLTGPALRAVEGRLRVGVRLLAAGATLAVALLALWATGTLTWVVG